MLKSIKQFSTINRIKFFRLLRNRQHPIKIVENAGNPIHMISYREYSSNGGNGGGSAVMSMCYDLLKEGGNITFSFKDKRYYKHNALNTLWGAYNFTKEKTNCDKPETLYITHDEDTAFALYLLGKKYVLIHHLQGSRIDEIYRYKVSLSKKNIRLLMGIEAIVFRNAIFVCFPSAGATHEFLSSKNRWNFKFSIGPVLYNTVFAPKIIRSVKEIKYDSNIITLLSVGQMFYPKGMDLLPTFYKSLLDSFPAKSFRAILVGNGELKSKINSELSELSSKFSNFSYIQYDKLPHEELSYLQKISNAYVMLHRISIFDLSTLEMMMNGKAVILSKRGGNLSFNKENNIIFSDGNKWPSNLNINELNHYGELNRKVFEAYFSIKVFKNEYISMINSARKQMLNT